MTKIVLATLLATTVSLGCDMANAANPSFTLTEEGVGSLKMKQPFTDMSKSDEGLYNRVEIQKYEDEASGAIITDYTLYMDNEKVAGFYLSESEPVIGMLHIYSPRISMVNGAKPGMSMCDFMELDGVSASVGEGMDFEYEVSIALGNICAYGWWLGDGSDILTDEGMEKAQGAAEGEFIDLTVDDVLDEAVVTDLCVYRKDE